jgi:50S ribosomal protein L16 3-hydroxylase
MIHWPDGLDSTGFLDSYWQKRPLLVRGAIRGLDNPVSPDDLAGLACEADVESRIVSGGEASGWTVRHGPFAEDEFSTLPDSDWILLVQDVDKIVPDLAPALGLFSFLPSWRLEDLMVSYSSPGGSVGPHVDNYDVFLIQMEGRRRWQLASETDETAWRDDCEIRVLKSFEPSSSLWLDPGDMLYIPPGTPHYGRGEVPCLSFSVGFRAPSDGDLLSQAARLLTESGDETFYSDAGLADAEVDDSRISAAAVERARRLLTDAAEKSDARVTQLLGRAVTGNKPWLLPEQPEFPTSRAGLEERLSAAERLRLHEGSRLAWHASETGTLIFVDGESWSLPAGEQHFCRSIEGLRTAGPLRISPLESHHLDILCDLLARGALTWADDETTS